MSEKLYYSDPYLREFEASIVSVVRDRIVLDKTAFYPGGGGQECDLGEIDGLEVTEVDKEGDDVVHTVPGSSFMVDQKIKCRIDWGRRYDLMRGHSGQHILFRAMQEQNPGLGVGKVAISNEKKCLFFNGEITWEGLRKALARANEIITSDVEITVHELSKDSAELGDVRIRIDKIVGNKVRVIRIGDFDAAACGGVHVKRASEIGGIALTRLISGRGASDKEIQFEVGAKALQMSSQTTISALSVAETLGCAPENIEPTVRNLKAENESLSSKLKNASKRQLESIQPETVGAFSFYGMVLSGSDRKAVNETASTLIRRENTIVLFCDVAENAYLLVGCNEKLAFDCPSLLKKGLDIVNGKGGGKKNFAMGGGPESSKADDAFDAIRQSILDMMSREYSCG